MIKQNEIGDSPIHVIFLSQTSQSNIFQKKMKKSIFVPFQLFSNFPTAFFSFSSTPLKFSINAKIWKHWKLRFLRCV